MIELIVHYVKNDGSSEFFNIEPVWGGEIQKSNLQDHLQSSLPDLGDAQERGDSSMVTRPRGEHGRIYLPTTLVNIMKPDSYTIVILSRQSFQNVSVLF